MRVSQTPPHERVNLWVICAAQFLTLAGMTAVLPLLPLYLQHIGVDDRDTLRYWTGALGSAPFAVAVFATPIWGSLADRVGYKPMVVRSVAGIAIATVGMGFSSSPAALLGWRGVQGAVSGVFPAAVALLAALTPEPRVGRALAILQAARSGGALSGPLLGGLLADVIGIRALFLGVGGSAALMSLICSLVIVEPARQADATQPSEIRWRELLRRRDLLAMLALVFLFQIVVMASWPTLALFVEQLHVERASVATMTGLVVFAAGLPSMLAATLWARAVGRFGIARLLAVSLMATGITSAAVGLADRMDAVLALRVLSGLSMAGFIPLSFQWLNGFAPANARGRMAGIGSTAMMLGNVVGPILGSWLSVHVGLGATFWVPGASLLVVGVVFWLSTLASARA
jgi:DHA1 family multidrug resistance protein-like MFS transporter